MNADGSGLTQITSNGVETLAPDWSPDGTELVYTKDNGTSSKLFTINTDGTGETQLTNNIGFDDFPSWSPDGDFIAFGNDAFETLDILVIDLDTLIETNLTPEEDNEGPSWTVDGGDLCRGEIKEIKDIDFSISSSSIII